MDKVWVLIYLVLGLISVNYARQIKNNPGNKMMFSVIGILFIFFAIISYVG